MDAQQPPVKNNLPVIIAAVVIIAALSGGLGYVFLKKGPAPAPQNAPVARQNTPAIVGEQPTTPPPSEITTTPEPPSPPPSIGFYGKVMKREGASVTIQQLLPPTTPNGKLTEGKTYTVIAEENISYINQKKTANAKPGEPPFTPEPGSLAGLTKGLYVYIETGDDIASKTAIKANQVMYSVESPF